MMEVESEFDQDSSRLLSEEDKWSIIIARKYFNLTFRQIQDKFQIKSLGTISKVLQKYKSFNSVDNNFQFCGGHNKQEFEEEIQDSIKDLNAKKYSTLDIQMKVNKDFNFYLSRSQLYRAFKKLDMKYGRIQEIHELTEENVLKRYEYCLANKNSTLKTIIFSDESIFSLQDANCCCWFLKDETNFIPTKSLSYKNRQVHIWGAVSYYYKSKLYIHEKNVNSQEYIKCINDALIPLINTNYKKQMYSLLQDGARSHVSKETKAFFDNNNINITQNPPWSPDLNAIELVWAYMKKQFIKIRMNQEINSRQQLIEIITQIWDNIPQEFIQNMINHTKEKMNKIIELQGQYEK